MKNDEEILQGEFVDTQTESDKRKELYSDMFCGLDYEWFCQSNKDLVPQQYKHRAPYKLLIFY